MSHILTINAGSSSIKTTLFTSHDLKNVSEAEIKNINTDNPTLKFAGKKETINKSCTSFESFKLVLEKLFTGFSPNSLVGIGHRFVHGGSHYIKSTVITTQVLDDLKKLVPLAPLHDPACLEGIAFAMEEYPQINNVAVFDTSFHHTIPDYAHTYGLPYQLSQKHAIRRYGFHGISHAYLWNAYAAYMKTPKGRVITLHLGSGCSMTAIENGISADTSMGFTPCEGLLMSTRCGDLDAGIIEYLALHEHKNMQEISNMLNFQSGLLGVSEQTADMQRLLELAKDNPQAKLAIDVFCYRIVKYLGAYTSVLKGIDSIIFSGGIGENSAEIRARIVKDMAWLGLEVDDEKNQGIVNIQPGEVHNIAGSGSKVGVLVIGTDESAFIANEVRKLV